MDADTLTTQTSTYSFDEAQRLIRGKAFTLNDIDEIVKGINPNTRNGERLVRLLADVDRAFCPTLKQEHILALVDKIDIKNVFGSKSAKHMARAGFLDDDLADLLLDPERSPTCAPQKKHVLNDKDAIKIADLTMVRVRGLANVPQDAIEAIAVGAQEVSLHLHAPYRRITRRQSTYPLDCT